MQVVSCDRGVFQKGQNKGCKGGQPWAAFDYAEKKHSGGLVSEQCYPYLSTDGGFINSCDVEPYLNFQATPGCPLRKQCTNHSSWSQEQYALGQSYVVQLSLPMAMEIMNYGPIVATMDVYEDLLNYSGGVYHYTSGKPVGAHAVRIIGWGSDPEPYWLVANSWSERWGDKGYFKIARGDDSCECDICNLCTGGLFFGNHSALGAPSMTVLDPLGRSA